MDVKLKVAVVLLAAATACSGGGSSSTSDEPPPQRVPGADWRVAAPEDHGMDADLLEAARAYAFADGMNTQGVVVVHDGTIVGEWYAEGADEDSWAASWSVAKSFTSALVGIAIEDGLIPGVDEPMTTWFPEWAGTEREAITLRDVLQMSSGLDWVEDYDPAAAAESDIIQLVAGQRDQLAYAAAAPLGAHEPGSVWSYSSADAMLLSGVIERATGMRADEYARQELFGPLDMEQVEWWRDARGHTLTYCCLDTPSRGFGRLGLLYARQGRWGGEQVVPRAWVAESLEPAPSSDGAYGYQWWLDPADGADWLPDDAFAALGQDAQFVYVIPSLDLVVVRNGTYVKEPGPPVADPNLFQHYPAQGLVPGRGTVDPEREWEDAEFLRPIVRSLNGN